MALSYGGRTEIVEAVRSIAEKVKQGKLDPADINEQVISEHLYTRNVPDPDLLDPHQRRDARQQFSALADFLRRTGRHADPLAGFPQAAIFRRAGGIHPPPPPIRLGVAQRLVAQASRLWMTRRPAGRNPVPARREKYHRNVATSCNFRLLPAISCKAERFCSGKSCNFCQRSYPGCTSPNASKDRRPKGL